MARKQSADPEVQYFRYLNRLRSAGRTNMYGAVPYLMRAFGLERQPAFEVICRWIDAFEEKRSAASPDGGSEIPGPLPPRATRAPAPVVVHRPRRARRARPPANRKPLPVVEIRIGKPAPARKAPAKPAARKPKPRRR